MNAKIALAAAFLAASATPALAAPWMAIDASPNIMVMVDRGSIERYGAVRTARTLWIVKGRPPSVATLRLYCDMNKFEDAGQQPVNSDMSLAPMVPGSSRTNDAPAGSIGAAILANVCQDRLVNTSAGWTRPDLKSAIEAARASGYTPAWP
jgi:hypothetical protein